VHRAAPVVALLLLAVSSAAADTIVLKNGRRITAANVTDDGEHVSYETSAGRFSLPKSIVARIEKDACCLDARTVLRGEDEQLIDAVEAAVKSVLK